MISKPTTKELIVESAFELLRLKPMKDISVQEIAENCDVSRKTFYNYFTDKYEVFEWFYKQYAMPYFTSVSKEYPLSSVLKDTMNLLADRKESLRNNLTPETHQFCYKILKQTLLNVLQKNRSELDSSLVFSVDFFCHGVSSFTSNWLNDRRPFAAYHTEEIVQEILKCLPPGLEAALAENDLL